MTSITIISGGQTGVDRAALDFALKNNIPCRGWCPRGRLSEDGPLSPRYPLKETPSSDYAERTAQNIIEADGTLICNTGKLEGGTALTARLAKSNSNPFMIIDLVERDHLENSMNTLDWIDENKISQLNIAGPRASKNVKIYDLTSAFLEALFREIGPLQK